MVTVLEREADSKHHEKKTYRVGLELVETHSDSNTVRWKFQQVGVEGINRQFCCQCLQTQFFSRLFQPWINDQCL